MARSAVQYDNTIQFNPAQPAPAHLAEGAREGGGAAVVRSALEDVEKACGRREDHVPQQQRALEAGVGPLCPRGAKPESLAQERVNL